MFSAGVDMNISVDNREKKSRIASFVKFFTGEEYHKDINEYEGHGNHVIIRMLPIGDYIFNDTLCIEYKSAIDFIGSVMDGRVFKQSNRMREYPYSYVVIAGDLSGEINTYNTNAHFRWNNKRKKGFTVKSALGAIARLSIDGKVLQVNNMQQAWILLNSLANKVDNDKEHIVQPLRLDNPVASFLTCIPVNRTQRLAGKKAVKIQKELNLQTLDDLRSVTFDDLVEINGIGVKTAMNIMEYI